MASSVTLRFYNVETSHDSDRFEDVLRKIFSMTMKSREALLHSGVAIRLEHLEESSGVLYGDFTRVQESNLPGQVLDDETKKLPFDRLGHYIVFAYDPSAKALALQFDRIARAGVVLSYVSNFAENGVYAHNALVSGTDSLKALETSDVKSFRVRLGGIHKFEDANSTKNDFIETLNTMGDFFDGRQIEVKISTRATKSPMDASNVVSTIKSLLHLKDESDNVKAIYADTFGEHDPYNFIKELLRETGELDLPDNDPIGNREKRIEFAKKSYDKHKSPLRSQNKPD
ncbi:hypothetical protein ACJ3XI_04590 [Litorimonas sp. RW-G-Af-16]|uniref:hypothetical protein n=1 Tax=Litorimonas sp. RW-G-Af-16 TaxID=3241168 RepID=UPI00390C75AD